MTSSEYLKEITKDIIRHQFKISETKMKHYLDLLDARGASECWHKIGTFKEHLFSLWRVCTLWELHVDICRMALFHSSYSNSYINLAIFKRDSDRELLAKEIGVEAEQLVYLFCHVNRHDLTFNNVMKNCTLPNRDITVKNIRTGEDIVLTPELVAQFMIVQAADFADQWFNWQDRLTSYYYAVEHFSDIPEDPTTIWPGNGKPGHWMHFCSKLLNIVYRAKMEFPDLYKNVRLPALFKGCSEILSEVDERKARDMYNKVLDEYHSAPHTEDAVQLLREIIKLNPYVGEFHIILAQILIRKKCWDESIEEGIKGILLLEQWGTAYDKRFSWDSWMAWGRVVIQKAKEKEWPKTGVDGLSLGLVL